MLNHARNWSVIDVSTPEELAARLASAQCLCTGFRIGGCLFLNDSFTSDPDRYWEYAILNEADISKQVDSWTVNMRERTTKETARIIRGYMRGRYQSTGIDSHITADQIQTPEQHGQCPHCA